MVPSAATIYARAAHAMQMQVRPPAMEFTQLLDGRGVTVRIVGDAYGDTEPYLAVTNDLSTSAAFRVEEDDAYGIDRTTDEDTRAVFPDRRIYWSASWSMMHATPRAGEYRMTPAGEATVDGAPCFHLRLRTRHRQTTQRLTDLYVDERTDLIRRAVLSYRGRDSIALDFGRVGAYWLVTHGRITARAQGLFRRAGGYATFVNEGFRFRG